VEEEIRRLGGEPAFPVQSSRNQVAAHYCPSPEDETRYAEGDLAKLDIGVHVDGYVVDTAVTVHLGDGPGGRKLVAAAEAALAEAAAVVVPGTPVRAVSAAIERTIRSFGLRPMRNLCGHGVGRWTVHCPPPIPNTANGADAADRLGAGSVVAIEPFATDGDGLVAEWGDPEVFRLDPGAAVDGVVASGADHAVVDALAKLNGLPFARRQLQAFPRAAVDMTLQVLQDRRALTAYPPLVETRGRPVAQAEHTIYVGPDGVEILTR
jgi:methionyl aminopeptidase